VGSFAGVGSISVVGVPGSVVAAGVVGGMVADGSIWGVSEGAEASHPANTSVLTLRRVIIL
jgi:hypothetical protein